MFRNVFIFIFLFLITFNNLFGQKIIGNAPGYKGKYVSLLTIDDYINIHYKSLGKVKIDSNGAFEFNLEDNKEDFKAFLEIEDKSGLFYVDHTTEEYKIHFPSKDENGKPITSNNVYLIFEELPKNDLNTLILEFNLRFDDFLYGDTTKMMLTLLQNNTFKDSLDKFKKDLLEYYKPINKPYFHNYIRYSIASIDQMASGKEIAVNRLLVYNNYIKERPILYNNDAYMLFFNQFYENSLYAPVKGGKDRLYFAINNYGSLDKLMEVLSDDIFLKNEQIRELVAIKGLGEVYYKDNYIQENILSILHKIEQESMYKENRQIAKNTIDLLTRLTTGYHAPDFYLINQKGDSVNLKTYKGKYIYIGFFATWDAESLLELEAIEKMYNKYDKYIKIVSVSVDKDEKAFNDFLKSTKYKWDICYYAGEIGLLHDYKVAKVPVYYLIGSDGKIIQSPALTPSPNGNYQTIEETFFGIKKKMEPKNNFKVGGKN